MSRMRSAILWCLLLGGCLVGGCISAGQYTELLQSADPVERAEGARLAGDSGHKSAVPLLVDRLTDRDAGVRFFSLIALRKLTGRDFGYRESDSPAMKAQAIARWRQYAASLNGGRP